MVKQERRNILVLDFGQLGDVVLSLPALRAIRARFPQSRITVAAGNAAARVIQMSGLADHILAVDRVKLRDGPKLQSLRTLLQLLLQVRRAGYSLVIDLHSLSESNLLGFLSGAPERLFAQRSGRALDFLGTLRAPAEQREQHQVDRYLSALRPLGIFSAPRIPELAALPEDDAAVAALLPPRQPGAPLIGLFPGASLAAKRWPLERFADLARRLQQDGAAIVVFLGPEEADLAGPARRLFSPPTTLLDRLTLSQFVSAAAKLDLFVSNDTGPMHLAAAAGAPVLLLLGAPVREPYWFGPVGPRHRIIIRRSHADISVGEVYRLARRMTEGGPASPGEIAGAAQPAAQRI